MISARRRPSAGRRSTAQHLSRSIVIPTLPGAAPGDLDLAADLIGS